MMAKRTSYSLDKENIPGYANIRNTPAYSINPSGLPYKLRNPEIYENKISSQQQHQPQLQFQQYGNIQPIESNCSFDESTVCFESTESRHPSEMIRAFDKHMQEKSAMERIIALTSEILLKGLNPDRVLLYDEQFSSNERVQEYYNTREFLLLTRDQFKLWRLKEETLKEMLIKSEQRIQQLATMLREQTQTTQQSDDQLELKKTLETQIERDLFHKPRYEYLQSYEAQQPKQRLTTIDNYQTEYNTATTRDSSNFTLATQQQEVQNNYYSSNHINQLYLHPNNNNNSSNVHNINSNVGSYARQENTRYSNVRRNDEACEEQHYQHSENLPIRWGDTSSRVIDENEERATILRIKESNVCTNRRTKTLATRRTPKMEHTYQDQSCATQQGSHQSMLSNNNNIDTSNKPAGLLRVPKPPLNPATIPQMIQQNKNNQIQTHNKNNETAASNTSLLEDQRLKRANRITKINSSADAPFVNRNTNSIQTEKQLHTRNFQAPTAAAAAPLFSGNAQKDNLYDERQHESCAIF